MPKLHRELTGKLKVAQHIIADKGYDAEVIREHIRQAGEIPVIQRKSNSRKASPEFDVHVYKQGHLVESLFARLKPFRSITTRLEKLARNFKAMLFIACTFTWVKVKCGHALVEA